MGDFIMGYIIGGTLKLIFRLTRFLLRIAWWLTIFVVLSLGAGVLTLAKAGQTKTEEGADFGDYSEDREIWKTRKTGLTYPCSSTDIEYCDVQATVAGQYWRRTAISRLMRMGAIWRYRFDAVVDKSAEDVASIAATVQFPQEAKVNITLDHLDPAAAASDPYGLGQNREQAIAALDHLDWVLTNRGWTLTEPSENEANAHWYARRYSRPVILWSDPIITAAQSAEAGLALESSASTSTDTT